MMNKKPVITIDGPAGSGKSTISRLLAEHLSYIYLDTGALYRAVAYRLMEAGFQDTGPAALELCRQMHVGLKNVAGQLRVFVDGQDVTQKIRTEPIGLFASRVSAVPLVREILLALQRDIAAEGGVVAEGRDMGSVVFPDAEVKFFLSASIKARAQRRYLELLQRGEQTTLAEVENDMIRRDRQDSERSIAPLVAAADAVIVDSTDKTISQVVDIMIGVIGQLSRGN
jgi:cytidylate kinase